MDDRSSFLTSLKQQERVRSILQRFLAGPPQVLLLEGGRLEEREALALYWAALLSCGREAPPCLQCSLCSHILGRGFRDLFFFSGAEGPIKIEEVRGVRRIMGQKPDAGPARTIVFSEAQELSASAANALLKSLEEPLPANHFVLLVPQRDWLLPTLVSRSFILTLNWSRSGGPEAEIRETWRQRLLGFWRDSRGLFEFTARKSEVDKRLVQEILGDCRSALRQFLAGEREHPMAAMWAEFMPPHRALSIDRVLSKGFESLRYQATPSLVLDWVALQIWQRLREPSA